MKKSAKPDWKEPLRAHLLTLPVSAKHLWLNNDEKVSEAGLKTLQAKAVSEIISGVKFLSEQSLPVTQSLIQRDFDIGLACSCLLAKATGFDFSMAARQLGISEKKSARIGCLNPKTKGGLTDASWDLLYNRLWKETGKFLKAHPEFRIT